MCIDHCEEHTIRPVLEEGYWAGITLYPTTKATPERAADMVEMYGPERLLVNSSADWGPSNPLAVPAFMFVMRRRGPPRVAGSPDCLRQSAPVYEPKPQFYVRSARPHLRT